MDPETIDIVFNGESRATRSTTVHELLQEFGLGDRKVAVELNREIVQRAEYEQRALQAGDAIEIVQFVGGG